MAELTGYVYFMTNDPGYCERLNAARGRWDLLWSWDGQRGAYGPLGSYEPIAWADVSVNYADDADLRAQFGSIAAAVLERCPDIKFVAARLGEYGTEEFRYVISSGSSVGMSGYAGSSPTPKRRGRPPRRVTANG